MFSKSTIIGLLCVAIVTFSGCASGPAWTPESTPLIERSLIFGNPDKAGATISPDGSMIAYLAPVDGVLNVWVGPVKKPEAAKPVTHDEKRGIRIYFWAYTSDDVVYLQDKDGDENWRAYAVDLKTGKVNVQGTFIITGKNGQVFADYTGKGVIGATQGKFTITGGTGEFEGIKGSGDMVARTVLGAMAVSLESGATVSAAKGLAVWPEMKVTIPK